MDAACVDREAAGASAIANLVGTTAATTEHEFFALHCEAPLVRSLPAIPLIGGGHTRFQPIHADDLAECMARALERPEAAGRDYDLGAEEVFTLRELIERLVRLLKTDKVRREASAGPADLGVAPRPL